MTGTLPLPTNDPIARRRDWVKYRNPTERDPKEGTMPDTWVKYFTNRDDAISSTAERLDIVSLTAQSASIGATAIPVGALPAGLYRVTYYARITTAATTNSSLTVTISFTDTTSPSFAGSAMTGNTTTTVQSNSWTFYNDQSAPITYATTYASTGATAMQYSLRIVLESMGV